MVSGECVKLISSGLCHGAEYPNCCKLAYKVFKILIKKCRYSELSNCYPSKKLQSSIFVTVSDPIRIDVDFPLMSELKGTGIGRLQLEGYKKKIGVS